MSTTADQIDRPDLLTVENAKQLSLKEVQHHFVEHMNAGQMHFLKILGFDRILINRAEGMYYETVDGKRILDFFGGFGSLAFGHNHPRILDARKRFQDEKRHEIAMAFLSQYAAALSYNLARIAPDGLDVVFLTNCGSVANEAALKLAERCQGPERRKIAYASLAFHGKTRAALSVTDSEMYRGDFALLNNTVCVPFGDADALDRAFAADKSIGIFILETIQGGAGIVVPPDGYIQAVREVCSKHGVIWIADEVQCGYGRTGRFFAFEHYGVSPDIITLAKSLGAGKTAIGAYICRKAIHKKAYGEPKNALIHGPATFSGMGEGCITAIEGLNLLYDQRLIENAATTGAYLIDRLRALQEKYPSLIKDVRGKGLMVGVEFADLSQTLPMGMKHVVALLDDKLKGSICGFVGSLLLRDYDVLVAFTEYNRNVIRLEPPLIATRTEVDKFVDAFDDLLSKGISGIIGSFVSSKFRK
ncbi:MAG: aminotransferase class III-fold pyridoxal phosphate-dependent enzyme [Gammaproteobacteria bacterium]|nr:aminotransferase class III-fold pyridoxal phosphate-dependent enzyme [Gammaproteobacteria bacterium]